MKMDTLDRIKPGEWRVRGQLRHEGLIYGPGDPLPELTFEQAVRYEAQGTLVRLMPDGSVATERRSTPLSTAAAYLHAKDEQVLRYLLEHRPKPRLIQEILGLAKQTGRSYQLRFALELILHYAGVKHPHADVPRE